MWQKFILLIIYLTFYIFILRSWDWFYYDFLDVSAAPFFVNPLTLNARQLRAVLDSRGVLYTGLVEKKELAQLVIESGGANAADVHDAEHRYRSDHAKADGTNSQQSYGHGKNARTILESEVQEFTSGGHFNELVEDCKDSAWVVQVVAKNSAPILSESLWLRLIRTMAPFGIRFGIFDCRLDYRMCQLRKWNTSRLLLALPNDGNRAKSSVVTYTFDGGVSVYRYQPIMEWVHNRIGRRIHGLRDQSELTNWMEHSCQPVASVCLLLITSLSLPPFFLSALSVKFNGRANFAMIGHDAAGAFGEEDGEGSAGDQSENDVVRVDAGSTTAEPCNNGGGNHDRAARYVILSRSEIATTTYGGARHPRESISYSSLFSFFKWLVPDSNDIFICSVAVTNLLALFSLFECRGHPVRIILRFAWTTFKYNFVLLLIWASLLSVINYHCVIHLCTVTASLFRRFCFTTFGRRLIVDAVEIRRQLALGFRYGCSALTTFLVTFLSFNTLIHYIRRRFGLLGGITQLEETWSVNRSDSFTGRNDSRDDWYIPPSIANGLRFAPAGTTTLWGGIAAGLSDGEGGRHLANLDDPLTGELDLDPKLESLIRRIGIRRVCLNPRVPYYYILDLPTCEYGNILVSYSGEKFDSDCYHDQCENYGSDQLASDHTVKDCPATIVNQCDPGSKFSTAVTADQKSISNLAAETDQRLQSCPICLDVYKPDDTLSILPCNHDFHQHCVLSWLLQDQPTCPCCRCPANEQWRMKCD